MHPLRSPSTIDLTFERPETANIAIALIMEAITFLAAAALAFRTLERRRERSLSSGVTRREAKESSA
jgi:hypothetical protein